HQSRPICSALSIEQTSSRIRIVNSSTSASDTLMSPATTSPLSSTRSRTSTRPVDRPYPSLSGVGISCVFYGVSPAVELRLEPNDISAMAVPHDRRRIWCGTFSGCIEARQLDKNQRSDSLQAQQCGRRINQQVA